MEVQRFPVFRDFALEVEFHLGELGFSEVDEGAALMPIGDDAVGPPGAVAGGEAWGNLGEEIGDGEGVPIGSGDDDRSWVRSGRGLAAGPPTQADEGQEGPDSEGVRIGIGSHLTHQRMACRTARSTL